MFSLFCLTPQARRDFLGPQEAGCGSVFWGPQKCPFARGVREEGSETVFPPFLSNSASKTTLFRTPANRVCFRLLGSYKCCFAGGVKKDGKSWIWYIEGWQLLE